MSLATARRSTAVYARGFYLRRMVQDGVPGICRSCLCTDRHACNPPCHWADTTRTCCSSCVDPDSSREFWAGVELAKIAIEEGITIRGGLSSIQSMPGITRGQIVERLRMLAAIPDDPLIIIATH